MIQGYLQKKSRGGWKGLRRWQRRWFVLDAQSLRYFKDDVTSGKPAGEVKLKEIESIVHHRRKKAGTRFDVAAGGRVYALKAETRKEANNWFVKLGALTEIYRTATYVNDDVDDDDMSVTRTQPTTVEPTDEYQSLTSLQQLVFKCVIDQSKSDTVVALDDADRDSSAVTVQQLTDVMPDDCAVLRFLLEHIYELETNPDSVPEEADIGPRWIHDDEVELCMICEKRFTFTVRRHHCRNCGIIVCSSCSSHRMEVPFEEFSGAVRVCDNCFKKGLPPAPPKGGNMVPAKAKKEDLMKPSARPRSDRFVFVDKEKERVKAQKEKERQERLRKQQEEAERRAAAEREKQEREQLIARQREDQRKREEEKIKAAQEEAERLRKKNEEEDLEKKSALLLSVHQQGKADDYAVKVKLDDVYRLWTGAADIKGTDKRQAKKLVSATTDDVYRQFTQVAAPVAPPNPGKAKARPQQSGVRSTFHQPGLSSISVTAARAAGMDDPGLDQSPRPWDNVAQARGRAISTHAVARTTGIPMSNNWRMYHTTDGRPYYVNSETEACVWECPADAQQAPKDITPAQAGITYKPVMSSVKKQLNAALAQRVAGMAESPPKASLSSTQPITLPSRQPLWKVFTAESGQQYFYNTQTGASVWEKPADFGQTVMGTASASSSSGPSPALSAQFAQMPSSSSSRPKPAAARRSKLASMWEQKTNKAAAGQASKLAPRKTGKVSALAQSLQVPGAGPGGVGGRGIRSFMKRSVSTPAPVPQELRDSLSPEEIQTSSMTQLARVTPGAQRPAQPAQPAQPSQPGLSRLGTRQNRTQTSAMPVRAALPAGWTEHMSTTGQTYYHHALSGQTTWERPHAPIASTNQAVKWTKHTDSSGKVYYYNTQTGQSVWDKPAGFTEQTTPQQSPTANGPTSSASSGSLAPPQAQHGRSATAGLPASSRKKLAPFNPLLGMHLRMHSNMDLSTPGHERSVSSNAATSAAAAAAKDPKAAAFAKAVAAIKTEDISQERVPFGVAPTASHSLSPAPGDPPPMLSRQQPGFANPAQARPALEKKVSNPWVLSKDLLKQASLQMTYHAAAHALLNKSASQFTYTLLSVFFRNNSDAHGLALRILWVLLSKKMTQGRKVGASHGTDATSLVIAEQFAQYMEEYCSSTNFSVPVRQSIFTILLHDHPEYLKWNCPLSIHMSSRVANPGVWRALFASMRASPLAVRAQGLKDVGFVLIAGPENCLGLRNQPRWQYYVFPLFSDLEFELDLQGATKRLEAAKKEHAKRRAAGKSFDVTIKRARGNHARTTTTAHMSSRTGGLGRRAGKHRKNMSMMPSLKKSSSQSNITRTAALRTRSTATARSSAQPKATSGLPPIPDANQKASASALPPMPSGSASSSSSSSASGSSLLPPLPSSYKQSRKNTHHTPTTTRPSPETQADTPSGVMVLPVGWEQYEDDDDGMPYYYCRETNESLWEPPPGTTYKQEVEEEEEDEYEEVEVEEEVTEEQLVLPAGWQQFEDDDDGTPYYYCKETEESLWVPPPGSETKVVKKVVKRTERRLKAKVPAASTTTTESTEAPSTAGNESGVDSADDDRETVQVDGRTVLLPSGWKQFEDAGNFYYYNKALNESLWTLPPGTTFKTQRGSRNRSLTTPAGRVLPATVTEEEDEEEQEADDEPQEDETGDSEEKTTPNPVLGSLVNELKGHLSNARLSDVSADEQKLEALRADPAVMSPSTSSESVHSDPALSVPTRAAGPSLATTVSPASSPDSATEPTKRSDSDCTTTTSARRQEEQVDALDPEEVKARALKHQPKIQSNKTEAEQRQALIKEAYSHTVHVYVLIHYSDFIHVRSPAFTNGLAATFDYLVAYGGLNTRSTNVAHAMINSLISKMRSKSRSTFGSDFSTIAWTNLLEFGRFVKRYVLCTANWQDDYLQWVKMKKKASKAGATSMVLRPSSKHTAYQFVQAADYGIHWDIAGGSADIDLVTNMFALFKSLHLDNYDPSINPHISQDDAAFVRNCLEMLNFFKDCGQLLSAVQALGRGLVSNLNQQARDSFSKAIHNFYDSDSSKQRKELLLAFGPST